MNKKNGKTILFVITTLLLLSACSSSNSSSTNPSSSSSGGGTVIPERITPNGTITDTTPTYTWSKIAGVSKYQYQLYQGETRIFAITVSSSVCGDADCSDTPIDELSAGDYQWRVCAFVDGVWRSASPFTTFTLSSK